MKKFITLTAVASLMFSCGSGDRGELLEGTQGKGVVLAETKKAAESVINAFKSLTLLSDAFI